MEYLLLIHADPQGLQKLRDAERSTALAAYAAYAEGAARRDYGKLVALLAARSRDIAGAEDALSQAFAAARAELLARCGDRAGAREAYTQAIGLESDEAVR